MTGGLTGAAQTGAALGTQSMVGHMGAVFRRPSLTGLEVLWRWIVGIPFLWFFWQQVQQLLAAWPLASSGFNSIDLTNPWTATEQLAGVWAYYALHVEVLLRGLLPLGALAWVVVSGLGRNAVLRRMEPGLPWRPLRMMALQTAWGCWLALTIFAWFRSMQWAVATHIPQSGEPNLVGLSIWFLGISLGYFTLFALVSWVFAVAPVLLLLERRSALSALGQSFCLGRGFSGRLIEINLVMGIVKLALIVLAMVFLAAPLPFADEIRPPVLRMVTGGALVLYLIANDYFQVVRLRAFVEFWKVYREKGRSSAVAYGQTRVDGSRSLENRVDATPGSCDLE